MLYFAPQRLKRKMKVNRLLIIGAAAILLVPLVVLADTYQFIISGDPVAAATVGSCATASSGISLATGTLTAPTVATSLEARYRTWDESDGIGLRSDKAGLAICIK